MEKRRLLQVPMLKTTTTLTREGGMMQDFPLKVPLLWSLSSFKGVGKGKKKGSYREKDEKKRSEKGAVVYQYKKVKDKRF